MKKFIDFTFEGFDIRAEFVKDGEPPYDEWDIKVISFPNSSSDEFLEKMLMQNDWNETSATERLQAKAFEALEDYDPEDDKTEE